MFCPQCKEANLKSSVFPGMSWSTCMGSFPYYDEQGRHHYHDNNTTTTNYTCSNGHKWTENTKPSCWCGWPNILTEVIDQLPKPPLA